MDRTCRGCSKDISDLNKNAKVCSDRCRKRALRNGSNVISPPFQPDLESESPSEEVKSTPIASPHAGLVASTLKKLRDGQVFETYEGQLAMTIAGRIEQSSTDSGSSIAALSKELRQLMTDLMTRAVEAIDPIDELRARREHRFGA